MEEQANGIRNMRTQGVGSVISAENKRNLTELYKTIYRIDSQNAREIQLINHRLDEALECFEPVLDFVKSPENILGRADTKHGETAEHVNVAIHNARCAIKGKMQNATFDNVARTAPEDYTVGGIKVQSKYCKSSSSSLYSVLKHLKSYEKIDFGRDGSYYEVPKDQHIEIQEKRLTNTVSKAMQEKISLIEKETGHSFNDVVRPGNVDYAEVQLDVVQETVDHEKEKIIGIGQNQIEATETESQKQRDFAHDKAKPTWGKAAQAAGVSAGISGSFQLAFGIQLKCKQGKKIQDFTANDWKDIGVDTAKAAAEGGISGLAIYGMTNVAKIPSPLAAAGVSMIFGLIELTHEYSCNKITKADFTEGCQTVIINAAVCAVGAFVGEKLIPIPVLGSIIGSAIASNICKELLNQELHTAVVNTSQYVHGSTVSMLNAAKEISYNHQITMNNIRQTLQKNSEAEEAINDFYSQMRGLI